MDQVSESTSKKGRVRILKPNYECARCGYSTAHRPAMNRHLYDLKKMCPCINNKIELTQEIKEHILKNRIYQVATKQSETCTINQYINNYNVLNNYIGNLDSLEKLTKYIQYNNTNLLDFEDHVESKYSKSIKKLEDDQYKSFELKESQILEIINEVTKTSNCNLNDLNLMFDKKLNRLNMYRDAKWDGFLIDVGVQELIRVIKSTYLDIYEVYLIKKLLSSTENLYDKNNYKLLVSEYYKFIAFFDLPPFVYQKTDTEILGDPLVDNEYSLEESYMVEYGEIKKQITKNEKTNMKRKVADIIKRNTMHNVDELNKNIISLIHIDDTFRKTMVVGNII